MTFLQLLLIDPHDRFRESARKYLLRCPEFSAVEVASNSDVGHLCCVQFSPGLILVDCDYLHNSPGLIYKLEKLKQSNPSLDVLALLLFRDDHDSRCQHISSLVSGYIYKENFSEGLHEYLSREKAAGKHAGSHKGVD